MPYDYRHSIPLTKAHYSVLRYHVTDEGKLLFVQSIGRVCYPDDEVLLNACIAHNCPNLQQQQHGERRDDPRAGGAADAPRGGFPPRGRRGAGNSGDRPRGTGWSSDVLRHLEEILSTDGDGGASSSSNGGGGAAGSLSGEALAAQQQRAAQNSNSAIFRDMPPQQRQLLQERQQLQQSRINLDWLNPSSGYPFLHTASTPPPIQGTARNAASSSPRVSDTSSASHIDPHRTGSAPMDNHYGAPPLRSAASTSSMFSSSLFSSVGIGGSWTPGSGGGGGGPGLIPASSAAGQGGPSRQVDFNS